MVEDGWRRRWIDTWNVANLPKATVTLGGPHLPSVWNPPANLVLISWSVVKVGTASDFLNFLERVCGRQSTLFHMKGHGYRVEDGNGKHKPGAIRSRRRSGSVSENDILKRPRRM